MDFYVSILCFLILDYLLNLEFYFFFQIIDFINFNNYTKWFKVNYCIFFYILYKFIFSSASCEDAVKGCSLLCKYFRESTLVPQRLSPMKVVPHGEPPYDRRNLERAGCGHITFFPRALILRRFSFASPSPFSYATRFFRVRDRANKKNDSENRGTKNLTVSARGVRDARLRLGAHAVFKKQAATSSTTATSLCRGYAVKWVEEVEEQENEGVTSYPAKDILRTAFSRAFYTRAHKNSAFSTPYAPKNRAKNVNRIRQPSPSYLSFFSFAFFLRLSKRDFLTYDVSFCREKGKTVEGVFFLIFDGGGDEREKIVSRSRYLRSSF